MSLLDSLNDAQRAAVVHGEGPILVLAGAGSGKTRVLTTRIAHLIQERGVLPEQILAVTFTNKAAREMRERLDVLLGDEANGVWAGTFHAFGVRVLRRGARRLGLPGNFAILDTDDTKRVMKRVVAGMAAAASGLDAPDWLSRVSASKNALETPEMAAARIERGDRTVVADQQFPGVYAAYQEALKHQGAVDFDDLLMLPAQLLASDAGRDLKRAYNDQFKHVLVDEYQDTNGAQYRMVRLLLPPTGNILVVGDDDQSIYGWRGASIDHILGFKRDFPTASVVKLEENYRSTGNILTAANAVIAKNSGRLGKTLRTSAGKGEPLTIAIAPTDWDEARFVAQEAQTQSEAHGAAGVAILYRTNAQSRRLEDALRKLGVAYRLVGGHAFYDRKEIRDALSWARLASRPQDAVAFARAVQTPKRGIGEKTVDKIVAEAQATDVAVMSVARQKASGTTQAALSLRNFCDLVDSLAQRAASDDLATLLDGCVNDTGLREMCEAEGEAGADRVDNLDELVRAAKEWTDPMADAEEDTSTSVVAKFLEQVALQGKSDAEDGREVDCVTLMTIHAAKGLEFPSVILVGMDEGLFPHQRSIGDPARLEEERRLCYVALTRAKEHLMLTRARERQSGGKSPETKASRFLDDIPIEVRVLRHLGSSYDRSQSQGRWQQAINDSRRHFSLGDTQKRAALEGASGGFRRGQSVAHPQYGDGVIQSIVNGSDGVEIEVAFDDGDTIRSFSPAIAPSRLTRR